MKILVTGAAGFIGFHLSKYLLDRGDEIVGLDNMNDYYDVSLKEARLAQLTCQEHFRFVKMDLADREGIAQLFKAECFERVVNLAAQAGVRYSLENPHAYIDSNIEGFINILEGCRHNDVEHLVYASSSSVYGANTSMPFSIHDNIDHPVSLYAASKKANELMAHTYSHLYSLPTTGLRFFTVYGPWGRPDMAYFTFTKAILNNKPITVYNNGDLARDFTYIDDIVTGVGLIVEKGFKPNSASNSKAAIYNIGRGQPVKLMDFINTIGNSLNKEVILKMLPMQDGDVYTTWASTSELTKNYNYSPQVDLESGIKKFIDWYLTYNN